MRAGLAVLRLIVGVLFMGHGLQKLKGWFGGHGVEGTAQAFESMGLRPGKRHATAAGVSETLGGGLLALGALTPVGALLVTSTMAVAVDKVHGSNGPWVTEGGFEYNLVLMAAAFALAAEGPGSASVDDALGIEISGPVVALGQLALGLGSAYAVSRKGVGSEEAPATA